MRKALTSTNVNSGVLQKAMNTFWRNITEVSLVPLTTDQTHDTEELKDGTIFNEAMSTIDLYHISKYRKE